MTDSRGFTLVEIMVSLTILSVVLLGLVSSTARLERSVQVHESRTLAIEMVEEQLAQIQFDPDYENLEDEYEGEIAPIDAHPDFVRTTEGLRVQADGTDHTIFTVTVEGPGVGDPVSRTIVVAAP